MIIAEPMGSSRSARSCRLPPSTYHDHVPKRANPEKLSGRVKRDAALKPEITRVFKENFEVYGVRKVWRQLAIEAREL